MGGLMVLMFCLRYFGDHVMAALCTYQIEDNRTRVGLICEFVVSGFGRCSKVNWIVVVVAKIFDICEGFDGHGTLHGTGRDFGIRDLHSGIVSCINDD